MLVSAPVKRALDEMRYESPTPIQELVVEPLLNGEDVVGQAQTGTGKTAGFGIPIAEFVDAREPFVQALGPRADAGAGAAGHGRGRGDLQIPPARRWRPSTAERASGRR